MGYREGVAALALTQALNVEPATFFALQHGGCVRAKRPARRKGWRS